jgi:hypothetical protein
VEDPELWAALVDIGAALRFLVANVHNGPGPAGTDPDEANYAPVLASLLAAGTSVVGYLDTDYGRVPVRQVMEQASRWRSRYGVTGVFLDQVAVDTPALGYLRDLVTALRRDGAGQVVLNPGMASPAAVMDLADVVCTYEGPWADYSGSPLRPDEIGDDRVAHLVHSVDGGAVDDVLAAASARHAATLAVGAARGTSTWGRVCWPHALVTPANPERSTW